MRFIRSLPLLSLVIVVLPVGLSSADTELREHPDGGRYVAGELLVRYTPDASNAAIATIENQHRLSLLQRIDHLGIRHYRLQENLSVMEAIAILGRHEAVLYAEPNFVHETNALPGDPRFPEQWALHNTGQVVNGRAGTADADIDLPEALDRHTPSSEPIVAVIDTGVAADHPDLSPSIWVNAGEIVRGSAEANGIDDDGNGFVDDVFGWDFFDGNPLPFDENSHGTLVASVIASARDNGIGGTGVSRAARVMPIRVAGDFGNFSSPFATTVNFLLATKYAADNGASIINYSAGGRGFSTPVRDQLAWLDRQGVLFIAAAGNGGSDLVGDDNDIAPVYPASYPLSNVISVAATDQNDDIAVWSNFGRTSVDLAAPGANIFGSSLSRSTTFLETFEGPVDWTVGNACLSGCFNWSLFVDAFGNTWANDSMDPVTGAPLSYLSATDAWIDSPWISLPLVGPQLEYRTWHDLAVHDHGLVEVSRDGFSWEVADLLIGSSSTAPPGTALPAGGTERVDLSKYAGQSVKFRFTLLSDSFFVADGFYVDDVRMTQVDVFQFDGDEFEFTEGTSFAAPLVAGVAAMVWAQRPDLSHRQVREIVLESVHSRSALAGKVATGGRLNADKAIDAAIRFVPEPKSEWAVGAALGMLIALSACRSRGNEARVATHGAEPGTV